MVPDANDAAKQRIAATLVKPTLTIADALQLLRDGQAICGADLATAERSVRGAERLLRSIVSTDAVHAKLRWRGDNLNIADSQCAMTLSLVGMIVEQCQTGLAGRPAAWDRAITAVDAASEYLRILNGELSADDSRLVSQVHEMSNASLKAIAIGTVAVIAAPVIVAFVAEAGVVGVLAQVARTAGTRALSGVLTFCITNPVAAVELTNFAVSTTISIGMAGGPVEWARGLTTREGAMGAFSDIIVLYIALHGVGPMPASGGRSAGPSAGRPPVPPPVEPPPTAPPPKFRRVEARVVKTDGGVIEATVLKVEDVADLPAAVPPAVKTKAAIEQRKARLGLNMGMMQNMNALPDNLDQPGVKAAIARVRANAQNRAHPGSDEGTFGGLCECTRVSVNMEKEFPGGRPVPNAAGGAHYVYVWPYDGPVVTNSRAVIDPSAAQFTELVAKTPAAENKNLIPVSVLQREGLLDAVKDGLFSWAQHERFTALVNRYMMGR